MKVDAIVQARVSSTRLPQKILLKLNGVPLIQHMVNQIKKAKGVARVLVATTTNPADDILADYCQKNQIPVFRGEEKNVLQRFIGTAEKFNAEKIIRVCSDNPFLDPEALDRQIEIFTRTGCDYCSYYTSEGVPIILKPLGLFAEAVTFAALKKVAGLAQQSKYFEHVTMYVYEHPEIFKIEKIALDASINPEFRFTIDYAQDFEFCEKLMGLTQDYSFKNLLEVLNQNPELQKANLLFSRTHEKKYS